MHARGILMFAVALLIAVVGVDGAAGQDPDPPETGSPELRADQDSTARQERQVRRRRGSMVGYLDDGTIGRKLQVRVEAAFHTSTPDRAEFFYAKCGCYSDLPSDNPAYDADAPGPRPGIATELDYQQLYVSGEYPLHPRFSVFGVVPIRRIEPEAFQDDADGFSSQNGIGDVRIGGKLGILDTPAFLLTLQAQAYLPTGDAARGLGTDHASIEPAILVHHSATDRLQVEAQTGLWIPIDGSDGVPAGGSDSFAGPVFSYGIGPSYEIYRGDRVRLAPVVELIGWHVLDGFQTGTPGDAGGIDIVNLKVGGRALFGSGSVYVGYGTALSEASWYEDVLRLEYRHRP